VQQAAACRDEITAAATAMESAKAQAAKLRAELDAVVAEASAKEAVAAATLDSRSVAWREEREALKGQLAHFHERASLLPDRYAVTLFSSEAVPEDFVEKLASKPSVGAEEIAGTAENLAEGHLGNIAAVASIGIRKVTPFAKSFLSSYFGSAEEDAAEVPPAETSAAAAEKPSSAEKPAAAAKAPAAAAPAAAPPPATAAETAKEEPAVPAPTPAPAPAPKEEPAPEPVPEPVPEAAPEATPPPTAPEPDAQPALAPVLANDAQFEAVDLPPPPSSLPSPPSTVE